MDKKKTGKIVLKWTTFTICLLIVLWSGMNLHTHIRDTRANQSLMKDLREAVVEVVNEEEPDAIPLVEIDWDSLLNQNDQTIGWVMFGENNEIDYPIVQGEDNDFWLRRAFDGSYNVLGTVFADFRAESDFSSSNTTLFGHDTSNDAKFGFLRNIFRNRFFDTEEHNYITVVTPTGINRYQIFSAYVYYAEIYYMQPAFETSEYFSSWIETMVSRSRIDFGVEVNADDKILTLSTCEGSGNTNERRVVHAVLVEVIE